MCKEIATAKPEELILASKSPFRAKLLQDAGVKAEICGANIDERAIEDAFRAGQNTAHANLSVQYPQKLAEKLAVEKAKEVSKRFPEAIIIGSDQILELNGRVLHKAKNEQEAIERLQALVGKTHQLQSAYAVVKAGQILNTHIETAQMTMRMLSLDEIKSYLNKAEDNVLASVGVYQIEGKGIRLFDKIIGDYWAIIGLPLLPLLADLRGLGIVQD